jgi:hypothetical protein
MTSDPDFLGLLTPEGGGDGFSLTVVIGGAKTTIHARNRNYVIPFIGT